MNIAIIEARYPYKMSYLDEWISAWRAFSTKCEVFNACQLSDLKRLTAQLRSKELVVILHSVTGDSNLWLKRITPILASRACPVILFVGNEYSNPWLSMEQRLSDIAELAPDIVATQLSQQAGEFLYEKLCQKVVETPHALPKRSSFIDSELVRKIDLGYRGFEYPWYLLDGDRNLIVREVEKFYKNRRMSLDVSNTARLDRQGWYSFLQQCKTTVASEGGSNFVFKTDQVWKEAIMYLEEVEKRKYVKNDFFGSGVVRRLPYQLKQKLRSISDLFGIKQGASTSLESETLLEVVSRINIEEHSYVSGKAITSRHLDAIYCGTWQILSPGLYNGILQAKTHFTEWNFANPEASYEELKIALECGRASQVYSELYKENSYDSRIQTLMRALN